MSPRTIVLPATAGQKKAFHTYLVVREDLLASMVLKPLKNGSYSFI